MVVVVVASAKEAGGFEQICSQTAHFTRLRTATAVARRGGLLTSGLMRGQRLVAQILRLLSGEGQLGHGKAQALPEHLVAPMDAGAGLQPLDEVGVQVGNVRLAEHDNDQSLAEVVAQRLQVSSAEFELHPLADWINELIVCLFVCLR